MHKVIATDGFDADGIALIKEAGCIQLDVKKGVTADEALKLIPEYDGIIVRSATKVNAAMIEAGKKLKVIGRAGVGVDNVDVPAASRRGIVVMNTPEANTISTAEHTVSMLMALARRIAEADASMKAGRWDKKNLKGVEVFGKTIGIIGFGRIGRHVANVCKALGMQILAYDPVVSGERVSEAGATAVKLDDLFAQSDFITVHTPLNEQTKNLICKDTIARMKKGVRLINCARGGIINENDLCDAIDAGIVAGAAIDVFPKEPNENRRIESYGQIVLTPHIAASTGEAESKVSLEIARQMVAFFKDGVIMNAVNVPALDSEKSKILMPFVSLGTKLGSFLAQLAKGRVQELDVTYQGSIGVADVTPVTNAIICGALSHNMEGVNQVNAKLLAAECGMKVAETKTGSAGAYAHLIRVEAKGNGGSKVSAAATIFGDEQQHPRIVRVNNYHVDALPEGYLLILVHRDAPGVIGKIGTVLGDARVNINRMTCDRLKPGETNVGVFSVDQDVTPDVLETINKIDGILEAIRIAL